MVMFLIVRAVILKEDIILLKVLIHAQIEKKMIIIMMMIVNVIKNVI